VGVDIHLGDAGFNTPRGVEGISRLTDPKEVRDQLISEVSIPRGVLRGFQDLDEEMPAIIDMNTSFNTPRGVEGISSYASLDHVRTAVRSFNTPRGVEGISSGAERSSMSGTRFNTPRGVEGISRSLSRTHSSSSSRS